MTADFFCSQTDGCVAGVASPVRSASLDGSSVLLLCGLRPDYDPERPRQAPPPTRLSTIYTNQTRFRGRPLLGRELGESTVVRSLTGHRWVLVCRVGHERVVWASAITANKPIACRSCASLARHGGKR